MSLPLERVTIAPLEEGATNMPVELFADRRALGIFGNTTGSVWNPGAQETPQLAQSVDTEGALLVATTIGTRNSPVIKFGVVEPLDPAGTNWALNPQCVSGGSAFTQVKASGASSFQLIRDLVGYDYAVLQVNPGTNSGEGIISPAGTIPSPSGSLTAGVWLKGANGGEAVTLSLAAGTTVTSNATLTTGWKWYTVTATSSASPVFEVVGQASVVLAFYATGWSIVPGASLANGFDGTFPGCVWSGAPHASQSTRPGPGGPRLTAIQADLEAAVKQLSLSGGTIRRSLPTSSGGTFRVTYDVLNAQLSWDDTEWQVGGIAQGMITCLAEPYGRGPEMTVATDSFNPLISGNYVVDAGALSNFGWGATGLSAASNLTTENRFLYQGEYPLYSGEVQATFTPKATISGFKGGVILERGDSTDYIEGYVNDDGTHSFLKVDKIVAGARTNVLSVQLSARIVNGTAYTVRLRTQRQNNVDNVYAEYFAATAAPTATTAPTNTLGPYVVTDAIFSALTPGLGGIVFTPQTSAALATSLIISPYLARERTLPVLRFGLAGVPGTAPGLGRMIVQDDSGNDQYFCRWGQQHDRLSRMASTTDFFYEAEALTPVNGASVVTGTGASGGNVVQSATLAKTPAGVLSTQLTGGGSQLGHLGDYEVWARVIYNLPGNSNGTLSLALQWSAGDLRQWVVNPTVQVGNDTFDAHSQQFLQINLGTIRIPAATAGAQQWQGIVLAASGANVNTTVSIDYLFLVPLTDGGAAVSGNVAGVAPGALTAHDEFRQVSATMSGATLPQGGTWTTAGSSAGDFAIDTTDHWVQRSVTTDTGALAAGGRFAVASSSSLAGCVVQGDVGTIASGTVSDAFSGIVARYVNTTNYLLLAVQWRYGLASSPYAAVLQLWKYVSGTGTFLGGGTVQVINNATWFMPIQLVVDAAGRFFAFWGSYVTPRPAMPSLAFSFAGQDAALATGGALASGLSGFYDFGDASSVTRQFANYWSGAFNGDAAFFSGKQLEVRSDRANRQNSSATIWTPPSSYVGQYLRVPTPAYYDGVDNVLVKATRNNPAFFAPDPAGDAIEAQVNVTPRYSTIPSL